MNADDDTDDEDPVEDAAVVFEVVDGDAEPVLVVGEVESCDGTEAADEAAAAADFSISSNSRLNIDSRQPIR